MQFSSGALTKNVARPDQFTRECVLAGELLNIRPAFLDVSSLNSGRIPFTVSAVFLSGPADGPEPAAWPPSVAAELSQQPLFRVQPSGDDPLNCVR
jgi:hypothetical protein